MKARDGIEAQHGHNDVPGDEYPDPPAAPAHRPNSTPFWQPPLGEKLLGITSYQDMVVVATDRMIYLIHEQGRSFDHTVIAAIAQKD